jgi:hypothetical protein
VRAMIVPLVPRRASVHVAGLNSPAPASEPAAQCSVAEGDRFVEPAPASGSPYPLAGRSPSPSRLRLTRTCLRCAIHGSAGQLRRLRDTGSPKPPRLVGAQNFRRRRSVRCGRADGQIRGLLRAHHHS